MKFEKQTFFGGKSFALDPKNSKYQNILILAHNLMFKTFLSLKGNLLDLKKKSLKFL